MQIILISLHLHEKMKNIQMCSVAGLWHISERDTCPTLQCWSYVMHQISHHHHQRAALQNGSNRETWQTCPVVFVHSPGWASKLPIAHLPFHVNSPVTEKQIFLWVFESCRHVETAWVRNMVSKNFLPFQLQRGNLVLKLGDILGSIMPCRTQ